MFILFYFYFLNILTKRCLFLLTELTFVTATAAAALKANDPTHWGWGEDIRPDSSAQGSQAYLIRAKTRPVSAHVNCSPMEIRFSGKETILRLLNSWYVES